MPSWWKGTARWTNLTSLASRIVLSKALGSAVLSGAINGDGALTIRADKTAVDSRYAKIMQVMRESEQRRPELRRLGDQLGAIYTPLAVAIALVAWVASGEAQRFLAVLVVATPCPLLIAHPRRDHRLRFSGGSARHHYQGSGRAGKDRHVPHGDLRQDRHPHLWAAQINGRSSRRGLHQIRSAGLRREPRALLAAPACGAPPLAAAHEPVSSLRKPREVSERPGEGLRGIVGGREVHVTSRKEFAGSVPGVPRRCFRRRLADWSA